MNFKLKEQIIKKYGSQADFCFSVKEHEAVVSRVVRGRYDLPADKKEKWARALGCKVEEVFGDD
jgi:hypothetical protein